MSNKKVSVRHIWPYNFLTDLLVQKKGEPRQVFLPPDDEALRARHLEVVETIVNECFNAFERDIIYDYYVKGKTLKQMATEWHDKNTYRLSFLKSVYRMRASRIIMPRDPADNEAHWQGINRQIHKNVDEGLSALGNQDISGVDYSYHMAFYDRCRKKGG